MKIIKIEGGLGSQMSQIALYFKLCGQDEKTFVELSNYAKNSIHNGWEIEKIFKNCKIDKLCYKSPLKKVKRSILEKIFKKFLKNKNVFIESQERFFLNRNLRFLEKNFGVKIEKIYSYIGSFYDKESLKFNGDAYYIGTSLNPRVFEGIEDKVRKIYEFPEFKNEKNKEILKKTKNMESVSLHVRRGDYLGNNVLGGMTNLKYYKEAISYIENRLKNPIFLVFSNDILWCKNNFGDKENIIYIDWNKKEESFRDLQLMSLCKHNIISNSTFSWWGAWLNKNPKKIVISPEKWFTDKSGLLSNEINLKKWVKIKNYE